jgi:hypothetical protein
MPENIRYAFYLRITWKPSHKVKNVSNHYTWSLSKCDILIAATSEANQKHLYQEVVSLLGQLSFGKRDGEEDGHDADDVGRVADEPVEPVEDRTPGCAGVTTKKCHERLDEAKTGCDTTENLE